MAIILPGYLKYISVFVLLTAILYQYETSSDNKTLLITKEATFQYNRSHVYSIVSDIKRYPLVSSSNYNHLIVLSTNESFSGIPMSVLLNRMPKVKVFD